MSFESFQDIMAPYVRPLDPIKTGEKYHIRNQDPWDLKAVLFDIYGTLFVSASGELKTSELKTDELKTSIKTDTSSEAAGMTSSQPPSPHDVSNLLKKYHVSASPARLRLNLVHAIETEHATLRRQGIDFPEVQIDAVWQKLLGFKDRKTARRFAVEYEMMHNPVFPMPHLREILEFLSAKKIIMGIISNAQFFTPHLFDLFLGKFPENLGFDPDLIFYSCDHGHAKPSCFLFEMAREQLNSKGIPAENVLYAGNDMKNDITPAGRTGFKTCLFAGDRRSLRLRKDEKYDLHPPDVVICDLIQLADVIRSK